MMSPVDIDTLRAMSIKLNDSPETQSSYEQVRTFINDLLTYMTETGYR